MPTQLRYHVWSHHSQSLSVPTPRDSARCASHVHCLVPFLSDRLDGQTRYIACSQLRGDIDDARAMAVASGMLRASALPRSCAHLKKPEQLQPLVEEWSISWTDMPMRHRKSGLVR
jgi:hypothetical protein